MKRSVFILGSKMGGDSSVKQPVVKVILINISEISQYWISPTSSQDVLLILTSREDVRGSGFI